MELQRKASRHLQRAQELLGFGTGDDSSQDGEQHSFIDKAFNNNLMEKIKDLKEKYNDQSEKLNDFEGIKEFLIRTGQTNETYLNANFYDKAIIKYAQIVPKQELSSGLLQPIRQRMNDLIGKKKLTTDQYNTALERIKADIAKEENVTSFHIELRKLDHIIIPHIANTM